MYSCVIMMQDYGDKSCGKFVDCDMVVITSNEWT